MARLWDTEDYDWKHDWSNDSDDVESVSETEIAAFEAPDCSCTGDVDTGDVDNLVPMAWRTIVSAAGGGRLRRLDIPGYCGDALWKPFAVRSLLPAWVGIDDWSMDDDQERWGRGDDGLRNSRSKDWLMAAVLLRRALYHMSRLRHQRAESETRRHLSCGDVKAMHVEFMDDPPLFCHQPYKQEEEQEPECYRPWRRYLAWLRDDEELAQQVADAWNAVVKRGGADLLPCYCRKCYSPALDCK